METCHMCSGEKRVHYLVLGWRECPECQGVGIVDYPDNSDTDDYYEDEWYEEDDDGWDSYFVPEEPPHFGFTVLLFDGEHWSEAYGYLGSYYKKFKTAKQEIDWFMRTYPEQYTAWQIERIYIDEYGARQNHPRCCVLAMSKDADVFSMENDRAVDVNEVPF